MPPSAPHTFPALRNSGGAAHRRSLLMMGAGTSYGMVSLPPALLAGKGASASVVIGCDPPAAAESLYAWAERAHNHLIGAGNSNPKLTLGMALDLTRERMWRGFGATERSTPRHRVIARFGREGLWEQIWSFNWDCVQESAFDNVGMLRDHVDTRIPWPTGFRTFVTAAECAHAAEENMVHVMKPHGCVGALVEADAASRSGNHPRAISLASRFLITESELASQKSHGDATQNFIFASLCDRMSGRPLITVGWSAGEEYLLNYIETRVRPQLNAQTLGPDELSVIDLAFQAGHVRLAQCYGKAEAQALIPVQRSGHTTDQLFLWIQCLYALERLRATAHGRPAVVQAITDIETALAQPPDGRHFAVEWVDDFLSVWVRLCWRCGLIECNGRDYQPLSAEQFDLERRDEHVPWNLSSCPRLDLAAAAALIAAIQANGTGNQWDFAAFPGGLYRVSDGSLVVPLPAWRSGVDNELRGLQPLLNAIQTTGGLPVQRLGILPLLPDNQTVPPAVVQMLKAGLANRMGMAAFAMASSIDEVGLGDL